MIEHFADQMLSEAGLISAGLLLAVMFMARVWQRERAENRELQRELLELTREAIAAEQESAVGLKEVRRLVDAERDMRHILGGVTRELELANRRGRTTDTPP